MHSEQNNLVIELFKALNDRMIVTAESCTGGGIASAITEVAGSSAYFDRGFVTYSNEAKKDCLGVSDAILDQYGAVSEPCAAAMVKGALRSSNAHLAISVTGIAGPDGGSDDKPVGLVYIGIASRQHKTKDAQIQTQVFKNLFEGSRRDIRQETIKTGLSLLIEKAQSG
jgi:nicotinamide-nucleotide amidase